MTETQVRVDVGGARVQVGGARVHAADTNPRKRPPAWLRLVSAHGPLLAVAVVTVFPFYVMTVLSVQSGLPIKLPASLWPTTINFDAYASVFRSSDLPRWLLNTAIYSVVSVVLVLFIGSMAAYAFAKRPFPGRNAIFWVLVAMMMVPHHLTMIPQFIMLAETGGLNTYWGLILPTIANVQALFLMRQFIADIPNELMEAARIDGAGEFRIFWVIVLPQTKPILATLGVFVFLWHWNDFLWPLIVAPSSEMRVLTVGLSTLQSQETSLAVIMAGALVTFLPVFILFLFMQKYLVRGVSMSGMK